MFLHFKNANTMHFKKSLYSIVVKKNVQKHVKCSRFECPYCKCPEELGTGLSVPVWGKLV